MTTTKASIMLKAYSLSELARIYDVDWRTFKKWVKPFEAEIGTKQGRFYTVAQVRVIFEKLSLPGMVSGD